MKGKIIEATNPTGNGDCGLNWGKFLVLQLDQEWTYKSQLPCDPEFQMDKYPLLRHIGFSPKTIFVLDLQTREGAGFVPGGVAVIDLDKHKIWCCPMFSPFLEWLYQQDCSDVTKLPSLVELTGVEGAWQGYRREGVEVFMNGYGI